MKSNENIRFLGPWGFQKEPCRVSVRGFKVPPWPASYFYRKAMKSKENTKFLGPGGLQKEPCGVSVRGFKVPPCQLPTFIENR